MRHFRKFVLAATSAVMVTAYGASALAFCFSNDSLSGSPMYVQQLDRSQFLTGLEKLMAGIPDKLCKAASVEELIVGRKLKNCAQIKRQFSKSREGLRQVGADLKNSKYTGPAMTAMEDAANEAYEFVTGAPVLGDAVDLSQQAVKTTTAAIGKVASSAGRELAKVGKKLGKKLMTSLDRLVSKRFRADNIRPDQTRCCNWKNRDCNPSGRKNAKIYFNVKYAGVSRTIQMGATDHLECRVHPKDAKKTVCKNYVFPVSPYRANKATVRGVLIKSQHSGKCLEVWGKKRSNGTNVSLWNCHGGKNQRWTIFKNGTIRSEMHWACLDIAGGTKRVKDGMNVQMWDCTGSRNQRWVHANSKIISDANSTGRKCLEIRSADPKNKANAQVWKCHDGAHNKWIVTRK